MSNTYSNCACSMKYLFQWSSKTPHLAGSAAYLGSGVGEAVDDVGEEAAQAHVDAGRKALRGAAARALHQAGRGAGQERPHARAQVVEQPHRVTCTEVIAFEIVSCSAADIPSPRYHHTPSEHT